MTEYKIGSAIVRIHGDFDRDRLKEATVRYLKQKQKKEKKK